jgi:hypothetical protein
MSAAIRGFSIGNVYRAQNLHQPIHLTHNASRQPRFHIRHHSNPRQPRPLRIGRYGKRIDVCSFGSNNTRHPHQNAGLILHA